MIGLKMSIVAEYYARNKSRIFFFGGISRFLFLWRKITTFKKLAGVRRKYDIAVSSGLKIEKWLYKYYRIIMTLRV